MLDLIIRADDFGSARSANKAIAECVTLGHTVKNISVMASGKYTDEGAEILKNLKGVDIGMHAVLNSEWDPVKWTPCAPKEKIRSLLNKDGEFYTSQPELAAACPDPDEIITELNAQLDHLTKLQIPVTYIDSHMLTEGFIEGMTPVFRDWVRSKGLLDIYDYYCYSGSLFPEWGNNFDEYLVNVRKFIAGMDRDKQITYILHPAIKSEETISFYNNTVDPGVIATQREWEYRFLTYEFPKYPELAGDIRLLRFSEAKPVEGGETAIRHAFGLE